MRPMVTVLGEASFTSVNQPRSSTLFITRGRTRRTYSIIYGSLLRTTCRPSLLAVWLERPSGQRGVGGAGGGSVLSATTTVGVGCIPTPGRYIKYSLGGEVGPGSFGRVGVEWPAGPRGRVVTVGVGPRGR